MNAIILIALIHALQQEVFLLQEELAQQTAVVQPYISPNGIGGPDLTSIQPSVQPPVQQVAPLTPFVPIFNPPVQSCNITIYYDTEPTADGSNKAAVATWNLSGLPDDATGTLWSPSQLLINLPAISNWGLHTIHFSKTFFSPNNSYEARFGNVICDTTVTE